MEEDILITQYFGQISHLMVEVNQQVLCAPISPVLSQLLYCDCGFWDRIWVMLEKF